MDMYESQKTPFIGADQWESVFETLEVPMMLLNEKLEIIRINNSMRSIIDVNQNLIKNENLIGEKCYRIVHNDTEPPESCPFLKTMEFGSKNSVNIEIPEINSFFRVTTSPIYNSDGKLSGSSHVAQDITDLIYNKRKLKKSLELKDLLMTEIHHRVKNNLVTIASLLYLQASNTNDSDVKDILMEAQSRAKSMAIMHQNIYTYKEFEKIDLKYYFQQLLDEISKNYSKDELLYFLDVNNISMDFETALILGLIINELVSNSLKYVFSDNQTCIIQIEFQKINNQYILKISDNGESRSEKIDFEKNDIVNSKSFGITLVKLFTEQLDGQISVKYDKGTIFTVTFDEKIL